MEDTRGATGSIAALRVPDFVLFFKAALNFENACALTAGTGRCSLSPRL
jgi:hypothetical protein